MGGSSQLPINTKTSFCSLLISLYRFELLKKTKWGLINKENVNGWNIDKDFFKEKLHLQLNLQPNIQRYIAFKLTASQIKQQIIIVELKHPFQVQHVVNSANNWPSEQTVIRCRLN